MFHTELDQTEFNTGQRTNQHFYSSEVTEIFWTCDLKPLPGFWPAGLSLGHFFWLKLIAFPLSLSARSTSAELKIQPIPKMYLLKTDVHVSWNIMGVVKVVHMPLNLIFLTVNNISKLVFLTTNLNFIPNITAYPDHRLLKNPFFLSWLQRNLLKHIVLVLFFQVLKCLSLTFLPPPKTMQLNWISFVLLTQHSSNISF